MENSVDEELEELHQRHRKEKKDLQGSRRRKFYRVNFIIVYNRWTFRFVGKLQALKKSASKGDKKKKKEVTEEIARLEAETLARQENELLEFKAKVISS